jgi:hypothetical protein
MCVLIHGFVWNISQSKKKWARYDQKCILAFMWSKRYSYQIVMKLGFSGHIFGKYSIQILWKSFHWEPIRSIRKDRWTDMTKLIAVFGNFANMPKTLTGNVVLLVKLTNEMSDKHETDSLDNAKGNSILKHVTLFMNYNDYTALTQIKGDCY